MSKNKGLFITIEGSEGSGKTSNIQFIQHYLSEQGVPLLSTREPGGTPLAEDIRALLLQKRKEPVASMTELLLMFAARAQHVENRIKPALESGSWVLCDRFTDSTYAYQGWGRGADLQSIAQLETFVQSELKPDLTFYLDIDVSLGLSRAKARAELDRFESEELAFFDRVRQGYLERMSADPKRCKVIDASQSLMQVQKDIVKQLDAFL